MTRYTLIVTATTRLAHLDDGDAALVGTHTVDLDGVTSAHPVEDLCTRVLDTFHEENGIENVDDLALTLYDDQGEVLGEADAPDRART